MGESEKPMRSVYERFLAQPDTVVAEIIHGALVTSPRPASPHTRAASALGVRNAWLIEPMVQTFEVWFRPNGLRHVIDAPSGLRIRWGIA